MDRLPRWADVALVPLISLLLAAVVAAVVLLVAIVAVTLWQGARIKRALAEVEERQGKDNG